MKVFSTIKCKLVEYEGSTIEVCNVFKTKKQAMKYINEEFCGHLKIELKQVKKDDCFILPEYG